MTLANCRAPFRQPAADELGRQHPIIAAQQGKRERKEEKKAQLSGLRLWRGTGLQFQTRLSLPGPALTPSTEHMTAHIYFSVGSHPSLTFSSSPGSLCPYSTASTPSTAQSSFLQENADFQGLQMPFPYAPPLEHRLHPTASPAPAQPPLIFETRCCWGAALLFPLRLTLSYLSLPKLLPAPKSQPRILKKVRLQLR